MGLDKPGKRMITALQVNDVLRVLDLAETWVRNCLESFVAMPFFFLLVNWTRNLRHFIYPKQSKNSLRNEGMVGRLDGRSATDLHPGTDKQITRLGDRGTTHLRFIATLISISYD